MKRSVYPFYISNEIDYDVLSRDVEEFVKHNAPSDEQEEAEGFINFSAGDGYTYFEYYKRWVEERFDPGRSRRVPNLRFFTVSVAIIRDPYMLMVFTRKRKVRDKIVSLLPIDRNYRTSIEFSSDFIEFLNTVTRDHQWFSDIMDDDITSRGRRGARTSTHVISEKYGDYDERFNGLSREVSFTQYAIVDVALEEIVVRLTVYPGGRLTTMVPGMVDLKESLVYISRAIDKLYQRYEKYLKLRLS